LKDEFTNLIPQKYDIEYIDSKFNGSVTTNYSSQSEKYIDHFANLCYTIGSLGVSNPIDGVLTSKQDNYLLSQKMIDRVALPDT